MPKISPLRNKSFLSDAIAKSSTKLEVLQRLGLRGAGGNYAGLKKAADEFNLTLPEQKPVPPIYGEKFTNAEVFVADSTYNNRASLKKRLFALGVPNVCNSCGQEPWWNGAPLTLQLEHKNGVWNDNRLENLEILCGHCYSQTSTFAGRGGRLRNGLLRTADSV